jgi:hypothetical protein
MRRRDVAGWVWRSRRGVTEISTPTPVDTSSGRRRRFRVIEGGKE